MDDIAAKRVHDDRREGAVAYVASEPGLVRVAVAGDRVGRFELVRSGPLRDVTVVDGAVVTAGADVLVAGEPTGFGAAVAVGGDRDGAPVAAADGGRVARLTGDAAWTTVGRVDRPRAVDAGLVAAADGVHRVTADGLAPAGLADARDVAVGGRPLAATDEGLYALGNGWLDLLDGPFRVVAAAPDGRATAVGDAAHARPSAGAEWRRLVLPDAVDAADVVDAGHGRDARYLVTGDGVVLADAGEGWRRRSLGVTGIGGMAVVGVPAAEGGGAGDAGDEEKAV